MAMRIIAHTATKLMGNDFEVTGMVPNRKDGHRMSFRDDNGKLLTLEIDHSTASIMRDLLVKNTDLWAK